MSVQPNPKINEPINAVNIASIESKNLIKDL